ncbi:MAG TPA: hypothetical protein VLZ83_03440 [Edaphocola sp.]|nr:hypothetical protein [Edaphocola sp.]
MFFKVSISIFLINQFLQYFGIGNYFTNCFLDDLLFFPVSYSLIEYYFKIVGKKIEITTRFAVIGIIITSIIFEILLPILSEKYTSDIYDLLFYILGTIIFMKFGKQKGKEKNLILKKTIADNI